MMHLVPISRELVECCPQSARESVQTGPQTTGQAAQEKEDEVNLLTTSDLWPLTLSIFRPSVRVQRGNLWELQRSLNRGDYIEGYLQVDQGFFIEYYVRKERENVWV